MGLLLAPGTLLFSLRGAEGQPPHRGAVLWSSPGAGQGIISRCSQGSCWVPLSLIKTFGPCLTKQRCSAGERSLWAPTEPAQEGKQSMSCQETWVLGDFCTPQLWGEPGGNGGLYHATSDTWSQSPATFLNQHKFPCPFTLPISLLAPALPRVLAEMFCHRDVTIPGWLEWDDVPVW